MNRRVLATIGALLWLVGPASAERQLSFILHETPKLVPGFEFVDGKGRIRTLADFQGKIVLLNIWATWCGPCRKEMPTLDRLQANLGGSEFEVVPLSVDRSGLEAVTQFYSEIGIEHLSKYVDTSNASFQLLSIVGLPTTLLIDRQGQELGRLIGPAEWDATDMVAFLKTTIAKPGGTAPSPQKEETTP